MKNSIIGHIQSRPCPHCGKIATTEYHGLPMCLPCAKDMAKAAQYKLATNRTK